MVTALAMASAAIPEDDPAGMLHLPRVGLPGQLQKHMGAVTRNPRRAQNERIAINLEYMFLLGADPVGTPRAIDVMGNAAFRHLITASIGEHGRIRDGAPAFGRAGRVA